MIDRLDKVARLPGDPRNLRELDLWLKERESEKPNEPMTAREILMIERLRRARGSYSIM